jgi:hypothetical protein
MNSPDNSVPRSSLLKLEDIAQNNLRVQVFKFRAVLRNINYTEKVLAESLNFLVSITMLNKFILW